MATLGEQLNAAHDEVKRLEALIASGEDSYPVGTVIRGSGRNSAMDVLLFKIDGSDNRRFDRLDRNEGRPHWVSMYDDFSGQSFKTLDLALASYGDGDRKWYRLTMSHEIAERP